MFLCYPSHNWTYVAGYPTRFTVAKLMVRVQVSRNSWKFFSSNKVLFHWLQVCLVLEFGFLTIVAWIDLFSLTSMSASSLIKSRNSWTSSLTVPDLTKRYARKCSNLISCGAICRVLGINKEGHQKKSLGVHSILNYICVFFVGCLCWLLDLFYRYINTYIRSDSCDQLLLRTTMRPSDKDMVRDAGQNKNAHAPQALRLKMSREAVYVSHSIAIPIWLFKFAYTHLIQLPQIYISYHLIVGIIYRWSKHFLKSSISSKKVRQYLSRQLLCAFFDFELFNFPVRIHGIHSLL